MAKITSYQRPKDGKTEWKIVGYLGYDKVLSKQVNIKKKGFSTKRAAQIYYNRLVNDIEENGFRHDSLETFGGIYKLWLKTYKTTVKESSYTKLVQKFNNHILPAFGNQRIDKITVSDVQQFANHMWEINKGYKEYVSNVSRIFKFAIKQDLVTANPVEKITLPRPKKDLRRKSIKYFTQDQLKTFLDDAQANEVPLIYTFFYLLAKSGCRQGELLGLQWDCVDFEAKTLTIRQTLAKGINEHLYLEEPKTVNSNRVIPLSDETGKILQHWRIKQHKELFKLGISTFSADQLVFSNIDNDFIRLTHPRLWMQRICKRTKLPVLSPHAIRHTFATILISQGMNFKTVSMLLGHASVAFTLDVYAGIYQGDKLKSIQLLDKALG
ncbi:tyrosine-type recombinase/integrase [Loigolactobacillus bifermentans]|uniref:Phage integrase n=1 Tax=Loigolactobacillus bifermentans DSM 20003 TaxID=1423726 RepID=A0A0R1H2D5_9LACO|nr:site-specific integrase [Loigolactobacillus bifermentans]KRK40392.1 phage integrase [Loigolactobacillus bifermentans DSM 20003]QGG59737.1 tyrosine-type recombinase/integrase [Loigolactobacillus bifermentans]